MNDLLIVGLLGLVVSLIAIVTPILKLTSAITTLNCNFKELNKTIVRDESELKEVKDTVAQQQIDIGNAKKDIKILYRKAEDLENRKE